MDGERKNERHVIGSERKLRLVPTADSSEENLFTLHRILYHDKRESMVLLVLISTVQNLITVIHSPPLVPPPQATPVVEILLNYSFSRYDFVVDRQQLYVATEFEMWISQFSMHSNKQQKSLLFLRNSKKGNKAKQ